MDFGVRLLKDKITLPFYPPKLDIFRSWGKVAGAERAYYTK